MTQWRHWHGPMRQMFAVDVALEEGRDQNAQDDGEALLDAASILGDLYAHEM